MKFSFDVSDVITKPISIFSAKDLPKTTRRFEKLLTIIDELGAASAKAQSLRGPITTLLKLKTNPDQRLYLMKEDLQNIPLKTETSRDDLYMFNSAGISGFKDLVNAGKYSIVGMLKVGTKKLFVVDANNRHIEISPLCVLDFYIDEKLQRQGYGKRLFEFMLAIEFVSPSHLAYDRPSSKFLSFLKKNYNLVDYIPQANNFVIFRQFGLEYLELGRPKANVFETELNAFRNSRKKSESRAVRATKKEKLKGDHQEKNFGSMYYKNDQLTDQIGSQDQLAKASSGIASNAKDIQVSVNIKDDSEQPALQIEGNLIPATKDSQTEQMHKLTIRETLSTDNSLEKENIESTLPTLPEKVQDDYSDDKFEEFLPQLNQPSGNIEVPIDPIMEPVNWNSKTSTLVANPRLMSMKPTTNLNEMERHTKLMKILSDSQPTKVVAPNHYHQPLTFEQQNYYVSHLKSLNTRPLQREIYKYGKLNDPSKNIPHMKN
ncbi:Alpha-tubulin N-acetyltransferase 1 [Boothiomyces sp. JEL0866]|nr:Alpha-tubulin N-acetyltransferase 1 [Boothiomyces sp. JEL0866]